MDSGVQSMKQKLISLLKTLYANKGFNAKELEQLADLVIAQNQLTEESEDSALQTASEAAKPTADFVQSVASRQVSDVKKPKTESQPEPQPNPTPAPAPEGETELQKSIRELAEGMKVLTSQVTAIKSEDVAKSRREQFVKSMEGTSEKYQATELAKFDLIKFDTDDAFNSFLETAKTWHADAIQSAANETNLSKPIGGFGGPASPSSGKASDDQVNAVLDKI